MVCLYTHVFVCKLTHLWQTFIEGLKWTQKHTLCFNSLSLHWTLDNMSTYFCLAPFDYHRLKLPFANNVNMDLPLFLYTRLLRANLSFRPLWPHLTIEVDGLLSVIWNFCLAYRPGDIECVYLDPWARRCIISIPANYMIISRYIGVSDSSAKAAKLVLEFSFHLFGLFQLPHNQQVRLTFSISELWGPVVLYVWCKSFYHSWSTCRARPLPRKKIVDIRFIWLTYGTDLLSSLQVPMK